MEIIVNRSEFSLFDELIRNIPSIMVNPEDEEFDKYYKILVRHSLNDDFKFPYEYRGVQYYPGYKYIEYKNREYSIIIEQKFTDKDRNGIKATIRKVYNIE